MNAARIVLLAALAVTTALQAQTIATPAPSPSPIQMAPGAIAAHPEWPAAKPEDVKSVDSIVAALYDVISGPAGQHRDWVRLQSLFVPAGGRLAYTRPPRDGKAADLLFMSPTDYRDLVSTSMEARGFFEKAIANRVDSYGLMTNVYSTYESRRLASDPKPIARGINSIELLHSGDRYYIVQVYWDAERPDNPIPQRYLQGAK